MMDFHWGLCMRVCVYGGAGEPKGPGHQSQAAHADSCSGGFKGAPACNMDETGAPYRTVRAPHVCDRFDPAGHFGQVECSLFSAVSLSALHSFISFPAALTVYCSIPLYSRAADRPLTDMTTY